MKAALVALAALIPFAGHASPDVATATYLCERGVEIPVTTVTSADGSVVVLHVDGTQITLFSEAAGSGARFGWPSDGSNYVWWTKGTDATLYWKTPEGEVALLTCTLKA